MQTPAILNISAPAAGTASAARTTSGSPNSSFNQMLSQQVAERRDADKSAQARGAEKPGRSETRQPEAKPQQAATKAKETKPASGSGTTGEAAASSRDRKEQPEQPAEAASVPLTATELLAQIAGAMLQPQTAAGTEAAPADDGTTAETAPLSGKPDLLAEVEPEPQRDQPSAAGEKGEFGASLRQAAERQAPQQLADVQTTGLPAVPETAGKDALDKQVEVPAAAQMPEAPIVNAAAQFQVAAPDVAQAAGDKGLERLTPRVGTPAWDQAVGQKVVWMVAGAQQSASLTLNPPDLGPLQVVLNVSNGQADASFYAAQPEVRQALEAALPKLRDMLDQAGVALGQASVSAGMPDRHNQPGSQAAQQAGRGNAENGDGTAQPQLARALPTTSGQGLVDTFV